MKSWRWLLLSGVITGLVVSGGCSQGISQTEYDKVKGDLNTAEARIVKLETDLNSANAQIKKIQTDYDTVKATYEKAKADLEASQTQYKSLQNDYKNITSSKTEVERLQKIMTQAAPYLRIMDLSLEQQRSEVGIRPRHWQYNESYLQDEIAKAVVDSKDSTLKSLWDTFKQNPQNESRWFSYTMAILTSILAGEGVPNAILPAAPVVSPSSNGQTLLRVKMLQIDGTPIPNLEVDLWINNAPPGPPNAGITNTSGVATFAVSAGDYYVGFNRSNFPTAYLYYNGRGANVQVGMTTDVEIRLFKKDG